MEIQTSTGCRCHSTAQTDRTLTVIIVPNLLARVIGTAAVFLLASGTSDGAQELSEDRELKELDLKVWDCVSHFEGSARTPDGVERNRLKNRSPLELAGQNISSMDTAAFLRHLADFDSQTKNKKRKEVSPAQKKQLDLLEKQIVSLTGYLVLVYPGPPETTNCKSVDFHDWHLEVCEKPPDHPPQIGDPTPIICEISPRTQTAIYQDNIRLQQLSAYFRRSDLTYESTGHKAQKIRVTGYLLWDDEHNDSQKDVGTTIRSIGRDLYHHPWRSSAWEIHPVLKIEKLDGVIPRAESPPPSTPPEVSPSPGETTPPEAPVAPSASPPMPTPVPTATPQRYVTILRQVKIKIPYGETVLQRGMRLPIISSNEKTVTVEYMGKKHLIPIESTDLRERSK